MHESELLLGTIHSETVDPLDVSSCLIVLPVTTKMWLLNHKRPALYEEVTVTGMSTSNWPKLSHTRTDPL